MKAMIFAAGRGTRLHPLTEKKPKALVEINGKPMLRIAIEYLQSYGVNEIIVNVHHFADQVISFLERMKSSNIRIEISDERDLLLDTGGGLKKAAWFFDDKPFLLYNVDILTNLNLHELIHFHQQHKGIATLAVRERVSSRYLIFNEQYRLTGWEKISPHDRFLLMEATVERKLAFSGIHVIDPLLLKYLPEDNQFSIIQAYLNIAKGQPIYGFVDNQSYWFDIGNWEKLQKARNFMNSR